MMGRSGKCPRGKHRNVCACHMQRRREAFMSKSSNAFFFALDFFIVVYANNVYLLRLRRLLCFAGKVSFFSMKHLEDDLNGEGGRMNKIFVKG